MHPRLGSAVVFALLITVLAAVGGCSHDAQASKPAVTAGKATKDLFMYGEVKRNGKSVKGARLEVVLTPDARFDDAKVGARIPTFTVARATSASDGSFLIRVRADDVPTKYFGLGRHFLNFELQVVAGVDFAVWYSTLWSVGKPEVWRTDTEAAPADAAYKLVFDLGTKRLKETDSFGQRRTNELMVMATPKGLR